VPLSQTDSQRLTYSGRGGAGNIVEAAWSTGVQREKEKQDEIAKGISEEVERSVDCLLARPGKVFVKR